jgi:hypothetical protein
MLKNCGKLLNKVTAGQKVLILTEEKVDDTGFKNKPQKISAPVGCSKHGAKILRKTFKTEYKIRAAPTDLDATNRFQE